MNWLPGGWEDYLNWQKFDKKTLRRINLLIRDTMRDPFDGVGNPEPLKGNWNGWGSRRITGEHRLVYRVDDEAPIVMQCRFPYEDW